MYGTGVLLVQLNLTAEQRQEPLSCMPTNFDAKKDRISRRIMPVIMSSSLMAMAVPRVVCLVWSYEQHPIVKHAFFIGRRRARGDVEGVR
jgi:hypothetical protein